MYLDVLDNIFSQINQLRRCAIHNVNRKHPSLPILTAGYTNSVPIRNFHFAMLALSDLQRLCMFSSRIYDMNMLLSELKFQGSLAENHSHFESKMSANSWNVASLQRFGSEMTQPNPSFILLLRLI